MKRLISELIQAAEDLGVVYFERFKGGHMISIEEYYQCKANIFDNYSPVFKTTPGAKMLSVNLGKEK